MTENYSLAVSAEAQRGLQRLPAKVGLAIVEFITSTLPSNPHRLSKPLHGPFEDVRSARRGDYRILIKIHEDERIVEVIRITHRADSYRP